MSTTTQLLTTKQVADRLGVSVATVNRWAREGALPVSVKAPGERGARLYRADEIERLRRSPDALERLKAAA